MAQRLSRISVVSVVIGSTLLRGEAPSAASLGAVLCADAAVPSIVTSDTATEAIAVLRDSGIVLRIDIGDEAVCREQAAETSAAVIVRFHSSGDEARGGGGRRPVASIQFADGAPLPRIALSLSAARYLMHQDPATRALLFRFTQRRADRLAGRMLGRALAHELGHYVLRSPQHSETGLMRATHTVDAFVRPDRKAFRLTAADRQRLASVVAIAGHTAGGQ